MLYTLFLLGGALSAAAAGYFFSWYDRVYEWGLLLLMFAGGFVASFVLFVLFASVVSIPINKKKPIRKRRPFLCAITLATLRFFLRITGVHYTLKGAEKLPKEGRFLLVGNHRSIFDPVLGMVAFAPWELAYVSKKENLAMPVLGRYMHAYGTLSMDRASLRGAAQTANQAAEVLASGLCSMGIYPEGSRNRTEEPLLRFHEGSFSIARRAGVPIAVTVMRGNEGKKSIFRARHVEIEVLGIISAEQVQAERPREICNLAREMMWEAIATPAQKQARAQVEATKDAAEPSAE